MRQWLAFLLCVALLSGEPLPRKVIALYDYRLYSDLYFSKIHQLGEMPLNHLGLVLDYYDIYQELPSAKDDPEILGVIIWLNEQTDLPKELAMHLLEWMVEMMQSGKRIVMLGHCPFDSAKFLLEPDAVNRFFDLLGIHDVGKSVTNTFLSKLIIHDPKMVNFERAYPIPLPQYRRLAPLSDALNVALAAQEGEDSSTYSCLIATSPNGGFVAEGYDNLFTFESGKPAREWYINPFYFFRKAFGLEHFPALDTTTLSGRRLFYSHIDGDGWNNVVELKEYTSPPQISSVVLAKELLAPHPDIPVTVGPIAADLDPNWFGTSESLKGVKEIFSLKHVDVGNHTFTHPFEWRFFENYLPRDEEPYLSRYPGGTWKGRGWIAWAKVAYESWNSIEFEEGKGSSKSGKKIFDEAYDVPRAYALMPFNPRQEVQEAQEVIAHAVDQGRAPKVYQWSGNCQPFVEMFELLKEASLLNLNGGDNRFDDQYPSYSWVKPKGRQVKPYWQIYASNSNENTYTDYWRGNFYAFNRLPQTIERSETPLRILPVNLYYHVYSVEKLPGLEAVKQNIAYIKSLPLIPVRAEEYVAIVNGFYSGKIYKTGEERYEIEQLGPLSTVRFDLASDKDVDLDASLGVIGRHFLHGSLYVALDKKVTRPVIQLKNSKQEGFSLVESSMMIYGVKRQGAQVSFLAKGYGEKMMRWEVPSEGRYLLRVKGKEIPLVSSGKELRIYLEGLDSEEVEIVLLKVI